MPPRKVITSAGIAQTMSSRCPEKAQFGRYVARVFEARNHQAKPRVAMITGTTIASMITTESMRISFSEAPMGPCGSSTPPQPERDADPHRFRAVSRQIPRSSRWKTSLQHSCGMRRHLLPHPAGVRRLLALDEGQQVLVDRLRFRGGHPVREALIGLELAVLQQLGRERAGIGIGHDLVV